MGRKFLCAMPTNLYGPGDNFDLQTSHVLPALIRKFHEAKTKGTPVTLWGTGLAKREFLHVEDCAQASIFLMNLPDDRFAELIHYSAGPLINVGCGEDITIRELADITRKVVGDESEFQVGLHQAGWHSKTKIRYYPTSEVRVEGLNFSRKRYQSYI